MDGRGDERGEGVGGRVGDEEEQVDRRERYDAGRREGKGRGQSEL